MLQNDKCSVVGIILLTIHVTLRANCLSAILALGLLIY